MIRSAVTVGALAVLLSACGDDPPPKVPSTDTPQNPVDARAIARGIESRLENGAPIRVRVTCPGGLEWRAGRTFTCLVKGPDGRSKARVTLGEAETGAGGPSSGTGRTPQGEYSWTLR